MENLEPYLERFSESGRRVLESAFNESRRREQHYIAPEHILHALITEEPKLFEAAMRELSIDPQDVRRAVEKRLENSRRHIGRGFRLAPETIEIFRYSIIYAHSQNRSVIDANDMLHALTTDRFDLLEDILRNPGGGFLASNPSPIKPANNQSHFLPQPQTKPSNFLTEFSLKDLVKNNTSPFGQSGGGVGTFLSSINSLEQTTHNKHESFTCGIESKDDNKFDEGELISSLRKDVENALTKSGLKITAINTATPLGFRFEYETGEMQGQIDISGTMKNGYYELKATVIEKSVRKTK